MLTGNRELIIHIRKSKKRTNRSRLKFGNENNNKKNTEHWWSYPSANLGTGPPLPNKDLWEVHLTLTDSDVQTCSNFSISDPFRSLELESNSSLHGLELLILCDNWRSFYWTKQPVATGHWPLCSVDHQWCHDMIKLNCLYTVAIGPSLDWLRAPPQSEKSFLLERCRDLLTYRRLKPSKHTLRQPFMQKVRKLCYNSCFISHAYASGYWGCTKFEMYHSCLPVCIFVFYH